MYMILYIPDSELMVSNIDIFENRVDSFTTAKFRTKLLAKTELDLFCCHWWLSNLATLEMANKMKNRHFDWELQSKIEHVAVEFEIIKVK